MPEKSLPAEAYPPHYVNKSQNLGRIVEGVLAPEIKTPSGAVTGFLYETHYMAFRKAMEDLRADSPSAFNAYTACILRNAKLDEQSAEKVSAALNKQGCNLSRNTIRHIMSDWKSNSPAFSASYRPSFKLVVGTPHVPVDKHYYEQVAAQVDKIRTNAPEFAKEIDTLLSANSHEDLCHPESWYKNWNPGADDKRAKAFARAVSGLSGLDLPAASTYVLMAPAEAYEEYLTGNPS